jgi:hypothetical protein
MKRALNGPFLFPHFKYLVRNHLNSDRMTFVDDLTDWEPVEKAKWEAWNARNEFAFRYTELR